MGDRFTPGELIAMLVIALPWLMRLLRTLTGRGVAREQASGAAVDPAEAGPGDHGAGHHDDTGELDDTGLEPWRAGPTATAAAADGTSTDALRGRAQALHAALVTDNSLRQLASVVEDEMLAPLADASTPLGPHLMDELATHLGWIERAMAQRHNPARRARLSAVQRVADDLMAPLVELAEAETTDYDRGISLTLEGGDRLRMRRLPNSRLQAIVIPHGFGGHLRDWDGLAVAECRHTLSATRGLRREALSLVRVAPASLAVPPANQGYDINGTMACLAAFWPALLEEVLATLRLGTAHLVGLRLRFADQDTTHVGTHDGLVATEPPGLLRTEACLRALDAIGFRHDVRRQRLAWRQQHGKSARLVLPLRDGGAAGFDLDSAFAIEVVHTYVDKLLARSFDALDSYRLQEIPGFTYGPHDHAVHRRLASHIVEGRPIEEAPARLLGAALIATDRGASHTKALSALLGALEGATFAPVRPVESRQTAGRLGLKGALRNPRAVRESIALTAAVRRFRAPW